MLKLSRFLFCLLIIQKTASNMLKISRFLFCVSIILIVNDSIVRANPLSGLVDPAEGNELSFVVSIGNELIKDEASNPYGHFCGGALITRRHVLTSASCFSSNITTENYIVYIGSRDLQASKQLRIDSWETRDSWIRKKKMYPKGYYSTDNDVAIVKLKGLLIPVHTVVKVSKIAPADLEKVIIAGWGSYLDDDYPRYLLKSDLRVIPSSHCIDNIKHITKDNKYNHGDNFFCTNEEFLTVDVGDRGSPILIKNDNGNYLIVGVHQKSFPLASEVTLPIQQHKHISLSSYSMFIHVAAKLKYTIK